MKRAVFIFEVDDDTTENDLDNFWERIGRFIPSGFALSDSYLEDLPETSGESSTESVESAVDRLLSEADVSGRGDSVTRWYNKAKATVPGFARAFVYRDKRATGTRLKFVFRFNPFGEEDQIKKRDYNDRGFDVMVTQLQKFLDDELGLGGKVKKFDSYSYYWHRSYPTIVAFIPDELVTD